ncbi:Adenine phosphoribosyltransferase, putative [Trypanosoma brucei gambiense DAL972]|uniref:adenine phosphoribosyltransferase n=1 Tax=Trypanosoma brucei gambiense (strain MHOM/CI/86/DAL972) TaxID=679716 RepID=C9ZS70_TRYB9|nr:Adenine phosphoribosyltransferase, putative [Trypanosoma brucei gambiense DAL972]CBH12206.1 Adenine phosphoribosyltransferase, putative [Trypanosoma brucei gambiense DAL972]|eukprot:XP_011774489.1 Adenine phosphoribosyltransferase, putative [Trypanosoma brucei gambiense DAL972]
MSLVEVLPNYFTLSKDSPLRKKFEKVYKWYSPAFSPHDVPRFAEVGNITENPEVMRGIRDFFVDRYKNLQQPITHILGFDSRGFLLGPMIAVELNVPFVLIRKANKIAGVIIKSEPYTKEYAAESEECMTVRFGSFDKNSRVVLIDDVIATGGTMLAGVQLVDACGATLVEVAGVLGLTFLKGTQPAHTFAGGRYSNVPFVTLVDETVLSDENCGDPLHHKGSRIISCAEAKKLI